MTLASTDTSISVAALILVFLLGTAKASDLLSSDSAGKTSADSLLTSDPKMNTSGDALLGLQSGPNTTAKPSHPGQDLLREGARPLELSTVDPSLCDALVDQTPRPDVAYQAGVNSEGHSITPGDLPTQANLTLPSKINIPLTTSLVRTLHLDTSKYPTSEFGPGTETQLGVLSVEGNHVSFNGKPISSEQQDNLSVLCMKKNRAR